MVSKEGPRHSHQEILPEVEEVLEAHIGRFIPISSGRGELCKNLSDASYGVAEVSIGRSDPPLEIISANLGRGKIKVLVGPNGAGKSTFLHALMERGAAHFDTHGGRGAVVIGKPIHAREQFFTGFLDQEELLGRINEQTAGKVLEDVAAYFKEQFLVDWDNSEVFEQNLQNQDARVRIETLMNQFMEYFELRDFWSRKVKELSGGERTKLALFMILLSEPDLYLFDEPTNHLDLQSITKLTSLLERYKAAGASILCVSHVDWFLQDVGKDGVLEVIWGKGKRELRESKKPYSNYIKNPTRERTSIITGNIDWVQKEYGYKQGETVVETPTSFTVPESPLTEVSLPTIVGGELVIFSGKNGTGKTKLLETLVYNTKNGLPKKAKGVHIAYLPQFWPEDVASGTLEDFFRWVETTTDPYSKGSAYHPDQPAKKLFVARARELSFGSSKGIGESWLRRPLKQFSGGEQRLLWLLATSSLRNVDVLVLDEPTNHMDRNLQEKVIKIIRNFPGAVLISTHDKNLLLDLGKDGGSIRSIQRKPHHIILSKKDGKTKIVSGREKPEEYIERITREGKQEAQKIRV